MLMKPKFSFLVTSTLVLCTGSHGFTLPMRESSSFNKKLFSSPRDTATIECQNIANNDGSNVTLTLCSYLDLQNTKQGGFIASSPFHVQDSNFERHQFRVLFYPRGGGHPLSNENSGIENLPIFRNSKNENTGIYLQYMGNSTVDATFSLRMKGKQQGRKFDVEWSSGMKFVREGEGKLRDGTANDFGAHIMQSQLLPEFFGMTRDADGKRAKDDENIDVEVRIKVYSKQGEEMIPSSDKKRVTPFDDIRNVKREDGIVPGIHNTENVRVGKIVVPVLKSLSQRDGMYRDGVYPGVEYRIMRIFDNKGIEIFDSEPGATYELKPVYPLKQRLEREWPVQIKEMEIPKLFTAGMYNAASAVLSLLTAVGGLLTAFTISQLISIFVIPSKSMDPTLKVHDVLLVEKVTPRLVRNNQVGDIVLFTPPSKLRDIVASSGGKINDRDLFIKRIAAVEEDIVSVDKEGNVAVNNNAALGKRDLCDAEPLRLIEKYIAPVEKQTISKDNVFVMGDCSSVSVDSRVWGTLSRENIVGRPLLRIFPFDRAGIVASLPIEKQDTVDE